MQTVPVTMTKQFSTAIIFLFILHLGQVLSNWQLVVACRFDHNCVKHQQPSQQRAPSEYFVNFFFNAVSHWVCVCVFVCIIIQFCRHWNLNLTFSVCVFVCESLKRRKNDKSLENFREKKKRNIWVCVCVRVSALDISQLLFVSGHEQFEWQSLNKIWLNALKFVNFENKTKQKRRR